MLLNAAGYDSQSKGLRPLRRLLGFSVIHMPCRQARALHHYTFMPLKIQGARWYFSRSLPGAMCIFPPPPLQNPRKFHPPRQAGSIRPKNDIYNEGKCFSFAFKSDIIGTFGTVFFRRFPRAGNGPVRYPGRDK